MQGTKNTPINSRGNWQDRTKQPVAFVGQLHGVGPRVLLGAAALDKALLS
jgi:hypothetical protein